MPSELCRECAVECDFVNVIDDLKRVTICKNGHVIVIDEFWTRSTRLVYDFTIHKKPGSGRPKLPTISDNVQT